MRLASPGRPVLGLTPYWEEASLPTHAGPTTKAGWRIAIHMMQGRRCLCAAAPNPGWAGGRKRFGCGLILLATDQAKVCLVKVLRYSPKRNQAIHIPTIVV